MKLSNELNAAIKAINLARTKILEVYNSCDIGVEIKDDNSPVTKADKAADEIIRNILIDEFPQYGMLTEESIDDKSRLSKDYVWIIDPVDGTKEFVAHNDEFSICIGLAYKHKPVLGVVCIPVTGEIYYGIEGEGSFYKKDEYSKPNKIHVNNKTKKLTALMSRFHTLPEEVELIKKHKDIIVSQKPVGSAIKGCFIAQGKAEVSFRFTKNTKEWDTCAMQAIVEQAGGFILDSNGNPLVYNREDVYNHNGYIIVNRKENFLL